MTRFVWCAAVLFECRSDWHYLGSVAAMKQKYVGLTREQVRAWIGTPPAMVTGGGTIWVFFADTDDEDVGTRLGTTTVYFTEETEGILERCTAS
jgi:hypothetical protein